ncbi:MAG: tRNA (adenosine(37)-N6)-threonylcarbamoyltransferase complex dimerization subunit type 1 TsaB [Caedibacter sp. 37-49]|nr:MAG: tRNA (adenosine(37)-N6)-threonylcarbamoyltransferase complex dimerization subunit type 1 TsaB [Caedibacter sp. 37-49]
MNILAFECANFSLSVAALNSNKELAFREIKETKGQDAQLLPLITDVLKEVNLDFRDLNLISTTTGPGSFTGIRVGLALARGFRLALKIPLITFNCFDWVFETVLEKQKYEEIYVVLNSLREELFCKKYSLEEHTPELLKGCEIVQCLTSKPTLIIGNGAPFVQDFVNNQSNVSIISKMPRAETLIELALKQLDTNIYNTEKPFYLRLPDITYPKE